MEWRVGMPASEEAITVRVDQGKSRRQGVIVVYYVGEVGHGFVAFVHRGCEGGSVCRRIDGENCGLPAAFIISRYTN